MKIVNELNNLDTINILRGREWFKIKSSDVTKSISVIKNSKSYGVIGNGFNDDTQAIQDLVNTGGYCFLNLEKHNFKITKPITIYSNTILDGGFSELINETNNSNIFNINEYATNIIIKNIKLKGKGLNSIGINAKGNYRISFENIDLLNHGGNGFKLDNCVSLKVELCRVQTSNTNIGIYDIGGSSNYYENCIVRENEYGFLFENCNSIFVNNCLIESNNRGIGKTGILAIKNNKDRQTIYINNCYFENNGEKSIEADANTAILLKNSNIQGNSDYSYDKLFLYGDSLLENINGHSVSLNTNPKVKINTKNCVGIYGKVENIISDINSQMFYNDASDSWYFNNHYLVPNGVSLPNVEHDITQGYFSGKSAKVIFPIGGNGYNFSRVHLSNAFLSNLQIGQVARVGLLLKANRAGEYINLRILSNSLDVATYTWITDTEWNIFNFEGVLDGTTITPIIHVGKNLLEPLEINISGLGVIVDGSLSLNKTD